MAAGDVSEERCRQQGLMSTQQCADVAKHCNDRKQAAKLVQVCQCSFSRYLHIVICLSLLLYGHSLVPSRCHLHVAIASRSCDPASSAVVCYDMV